MGALDESMRVLDDRTAELINGGGARAVHQEPVAPLLPGPHPEHLLQPHIQPCVDPDDKDVHALGGNIQEGALQLAKINAVRK